MRNFKVGDWWETRDKNKVMIWETKISEQTAWLETSGFGGRTLRCAFHGGGMASYPSDGYFIEPSERSGGREHENDLIRKCAAPVEFRRKKK
jgi:hypothetical protein